MKAIFLICLIGMASAARWTWESCGNNDVTVNKLILTPDPVKIPGEVTLELDITVNRDISDARLSIKAVRLGWLDITLPCVENIGSCQYPKLCEILPNMDKENWAGIGTQLAKGIREKAGTYVDKIPSCGESFKAQQIKVNEKIKILDLPKVLSFISEGEYDVRISVEDNKTNQNIGCVDIKAELEDASSGFWGKRRRRSLE